MVVDIGVNYDFNGAAGLVSRKVMRGTANMRKGPAMTRQQAEQCIQVGIDLGREYAKKGYQLFGTGDMGIGNTTPSSAIGAVFTGAAVAEVTGRGTGIDEATRRHKITVIERALAVNRPNPQDGLDVLAKVGGFEIGAIAGVILGGGEFIAACSNGYSIHTVTSALRPDIKRGESDICARSLALCQSFPTRSKRPTSTHDCGPLCNLPGK